MDLSDIQNYDIKVLEKMSQDCSRMIVFDLVDQKTTIPESKSRIDECKIVLAEYRKKMLKSHDLADFKPLEKGSS